MKKLISFIKQFFGKEEIKTSEFLQNYNKNITLVYGIQ